jgi:hypothetical protein
MRSGDHPDHLGDGFIRIGAAMGLAAVEGKAIAFLQAKMLALDPEVERA